MKKICANKRRGTIDEAKSKLKVCNTTFFAIKKCIFIDDKKEIKKFNTKLI